ncbi:MAG: PEP-CTERM sorting domain-containing protein [Sedimentisphaerales bacterium]|nr:PEP-CTERM sorting domain-containing protein [Sedimentisphaerales bacterium]
MFAKRSAALAGVTITLIVAFAAGDSHGHVHTHIGCNPDGIWGNAGDNQLWIFATPEQSQWDTIYMEPTGEFIGDSQVYVAVLDCWHSAHPVTGVFQLGGATEGQIPDWMIGIKRIEYSDPTNFWIEEEATGIEILLNDGDVYSFGTPQWFDDMYNENGTLGAYGFHVHTKFLALANGLGETFSATFTALDAGLTGYIESAPYTLNFVTVPEPGTICLLLFGAAALVRGRRR